MTAIGNRQNHVTPLVKHTANDLASRIHRGDLLPGKALPSERDLSSEFGVSRAVIRSAIAELENRGLLQIRPHCRPVVRARALSERASQVTETQKTIGIWIWPHTGDIGASLILKGIQTIATSPDLRLVIAHASGPDWTERIASEKRFLREVAHDPNVAGAIVWFLGGEQNIDAVRALEKAGKPVVFVDRKPPENTNFDYVGTDNEGAAFEAVRHLADLGHRRIVFLSNNDHASAVVDRDRGYRRAIAAAGLQFRSEDVWHCHTDGSDSVARRMRAIFSRPDAPTAIFAVNDTIGLQAHEWLVANGFEVPRDVSIVGFDGLLRWIPGGGHLSTAKQNFERIGQIATELLVERLEAAKPLGCCRHVLIEAPIVLHGSTGVPTTQPLAKHRRFISA